jgi:hypothetical protein
MTVGGFAPKPELPWANGKYLTIEIKSRIAVDAS